MKTAFISGASRGIGKGIATALAQEGYYLAICCQHSTKVLHALATDLQNTYHIEVLTYTGDIGNASFVEQMAQDILAHWEQIDVVVNNAGIAHIGLITDMDYEEWNRMISTNLSSCFYTTKAFVPSMIHHKSGSIINISSMWGTAGASCEVAYSASKGGVNSYTKALAKELAPSNIAVNAIACGVIDTDMNHTLSEDDRAALMDEIPAGRFGTPTDIGNTVLGILKAGSYLTGQVIGVDGGYL